MSEIFNSVVYFYDWGEGSESENADDLAEIYYDLAWYFGEAKHGAPTINKVANELKDWDLDEVFTIIRMQNELSSESAMNF